MRKLRIAHLIDLDRVGGVETMFADLIRATPPAGWEIEHYTIADSPDIAARFSQTVRQHSRKLVSPKVWHGIKLPRRPLALRARNRLAQIRAIRPDVVLAWNQFTDFYLPPDFACPLVYYEHGMSWYTHSQRQLQGFLPYVAGAIAVSKAAQRMLQLKHGGTFTVEVCPNPLRPDLRVPDATARDMPVDRPVRLGVAARLVPLKAIGLVVLALKALLARGLSVELRIAGEGPERTNIERLIHQSEVADKVCLLGLCDDMAAFYRGIDLFVVTSMHETMPLVCLEAMANGIPVIAGNVDGMPEVVTDQVTGFCLPLELTMDAYRQCTGASTAFAQQVYDPLADRLVETHLLAPAVLADAIACLLADPARYRAMSLACLAEADKPHYDYTVFQQNFYPLLASFATNA